MLVDVPEIILVENNFHHLQQSDSFSGGVIIIEIKCIKLLPFCQFHHI